MAEAANKRTALTNTASVIEKRKTTTTTTTNAIGIHRSLRGSGNEFPMLLGTRHLSVNTLPKESREKRKYLA